MICIILSLNRGGSAIMQMFSFFYKYWFMLDEQSRNKILGNIFNVANVSASNIILCDDRINFKLFSGGVFYNYLFVLGDGDNIYEVGDRVVVCHIFLGTSKVVDDKCEFIYHLFNCSKEFEVYQLMQKYL